jgi:phosphatidylglycerol:prolipoprotein diacylglycerol transferase
VHPLVPYYQVPVIHVGPLPIHGFGLLVALGFILGGNAAMRRAERVGLDPEAINKLLGWLVLGTFIGGHVGYGLMYEPKAYFAEPIKFLQFWQGLSSFGGFVVCVPLSFYFFKSHKLSIWPYMDSLAIGLALGWFFGRMGCTVAHDHPGTASNFWLAKYCRPVEGATLELPAFMVEPNAVDLRWGPCRSFGDAVASISQQVPADFGGVVSAHDMGFYEALWSIAVFGLFLLLDRVPRRPGFYVTLLGVLYAPVRFGMDFLRPESTDVRYLSLTPAQWWSIVFMGFALWGLVTRLRSSDRPVGPSAPLTPAEGGYDPDTGLNGVG